MNVPDSASKAGRAAEWVLQATMTQPMVPFRSEEAIDPDLEVDSRSAIDQFVATIEDLNIVLSRHSQIAATQDAAPLDTPELLGDVLDSLFAIDAADDLDAGPAMMEESCLADGGSVEDGPSAAPVRREDEVTLQLNNLVFLGYMSAVESYFRCLTRQLIWADEFTAESVQDVKITFGAARHAVPGLLPEVLMEEMTFITLESVRDLLLKVIGVGTDNISDVIKEYDRICQLRHCIVHRFGRLGSKNAVKLGFGTHRSLLERKIKIRSTQLEDLAFNLLNFVKAINNHIYAGVMKRSAEQSLEWQWDADADRAAFERLYSVFRQSTSPGASAAPELAYAAFKGKCEKGSATQVQRAKQARGR